MTYKVSQSKMKTWRRCRQAYHYRYVLGLKKKIKARPLVFGTIVHEMLEADAIGKSPWKTLKRLDKEQGPLFRAEREHYGDIIADAGDIMSEYFQYHNPLQPISVNGKDAEIEFEVPVAKGIVATGKIDMLAKEKGLRWLVEHKTFGKAIPDEDARWRDLQSALYVRILDMLGVKRPDGLLWDYIWSKSPQTPEFLKSGRVAKRLIVTLPGKVRAWADKHGISQSDRARLMDVAKKNLPRYFQRIMVPIKPQVVDSVFEDFVTTAKEMRNRHDDKPCRNVDRHCTWCDYEPLCRAAFRGGDINFLMRSDYEVRKKDEREVVIA